MTKLHLFELKDGHIVLDGTIIRGIRECKFSIKENDSLAELSLKMDVRILGDSAGIGYMETCEVCWICIRTVTRKVKLDTGAPVFKGITLTPNPVDCGKTFIISVEVVD